MLVLGAWTAYITSDVRFIERKLVVYRERHGEKIELLYPDGSVHEQEPLAEIPSEALWPLPLGIEQTLMDSLWSMGIRPSDRRYEQEADLRERHLLDMRSIAFSRLGLKRPEKE